MAASISRDKPGLEPTLRRQDLAVSREQALTCGLSPETIRHRIRPGGPWQRVLPGVYLAVTGTPTQAQREICAVLYAGPGSVMTGHAALRRHGLRASAVTSVSVLIPARRARRSRDFVLIRPTTRLPEQVCYQGPVQFTLPSRAVADAARELASFREVRALVADAVQQGYCRVGWLAEELAQAPIRNSAWLRRAVAEAAAGIRSAAEGDLRDLIIEAGLPLPMFNARLFAGPSLVAIADAWWPEAGVAVEVDSREWHLAPEDWERTLRRNARLGAQGVIVLHFTPGQIRHHRAEVVAQIRSALATAAGRTAPALRALPAADG